LLKHGLLILDEVNERISKNNKAVPDAPDSKPSWPELSFKRALMSGRAWLLSVLHGLLVRCRLKDMIRVSRLIVLRFGKAMMAVINLRLLKVAIPVFSKSDVAEADYI